MNLGLGKVVYLFIYLIVVFGVFCVFGVEGMVVGLYYILFLEVLLLYVRLVICLSEIVVC